MHSSLRFPLALALLASGGCSAAVSDLNGYGESPFACLQQPELREATRDLTLDFRRMEAHGGQKTVATVVRPNGTMQGRVVLLPTGAAALGARRLMLDPRPPDPSTDGLRCILSSSESLDFVLPIPEMIGPYEANDPIPQGPYTLDFWSDLNRNGRRDDPPDDHVWFSPVCDSGEVVFEHNTGFMPFPGGVPDIGDFVARFAPEVMLTAIATVTSHVREAPQFVDIGMQMPLVVEVQRQDETVGYLRTELECLVTSDGTRRGDVTLRIPDIIDGGNAHDIIFYGDLGRNGVYDPACDPMCRNQMIAPATGDLVFDSTSSMECSLPEGVFDRTLCPIP